MSTEYKDIAERFAKETADHEMTVLHDDGLYRHLRFRTPGNGCYWFDLITVPHALIFRGDGTSFVFSRIEDMFEFFRSPVGRINPSYWAEKLTSDRDSVMTYDEELLKRLVAEELKEAEEEYPGVTAAWAEKTDGTLPDYDTAFEEGARAALNDFEFGMVFTATCSECKSSSEEFTDEYDADRWGTKHFLAAGHLTNTRRRGFDFADSWEWKLRDFDWWFLWACHAIVWGIAQYDAALKQLADASGKAVA